MNKSFITFTPTHFKVIVIIWTILGLFFMGAFVLGAFQIVSNLIQTGFKFKSFPFFTITSVLLGILVPLIFILYYYLRITLDLRPTKMIKWLFILSFPMLTFFWITIYPSMRPIDIFYEIAFLLVHVAVFIKFPGYLNELRARKLNSNTSIDIIE